MISLPLTREIGQATHEVHFKFICMCVV